MSITEKLMVKGMHCAAAQLFMQCKTGWLALLAHSKLRACWQASKWERKLHTLCDDKIAEVVPQKQSKNRQKQSNKQTQGVTTALWGIYARIYRHHFIHCWGRGQCNSSYHTTAGLAHISQYSAWLQSGRLRVWFCGPNKNNHFLLPERYACIVGWENCLS